MTGGHGTEQAELELGTGKGSDGSREHGTGGSSGQRMAPIRTL